MPTVIPDRQIGTGTEPSAGIAGVWLVLYLILAIVGFTNPPISGVLDVAALISP